MNSFRSVLYSILFLLVAVSSNSQQQLPKTLLWRISGNGLSKPSYLFGTMHLTDKRLFSFGDSVYRAIERCEGLAIEINPDEMCAWLVNKMFDEMEGRKVEEILGEKDFGKYKEALSKKFGKPADQVTTNDIVKEKNKWITDFLEKGEMPTIVDAYLYNIARRQGKWLGGIEDISDQSGLMEGLVDKWDIEYLVAQEEGPSGISQGEASVDQLIRLYLDQDLEGIERVSNTSSSPEQKDFLLIRRNIKMARRIDSLIDFRTMFLAVGAAHLPGDSGVINLLQHRGFTVTPVFSSEKINSKDYTFKEVHLPWTTVSDEQQLYKVMMPANPATVKLFGMIEMKFLFDIFSLSGYCAMAVASPDARITHDSLFNLLAQNMFGTENIKPLRQLSLEGGEGREYMDMARGNHTRLQVFARDRVIYVAMIAALKKESLTGKDAEKFFRSFTINKNQPVASNRHEFTDSIVGISFISPAKVRYNKSLGAGRLEGWKTTGFAGMDVATSAYIMLMSREVIPGYYIDSDSSLFAELRVNMGHQYEEMKEEVLDIQGHRVMVFSGKFVDRPGIFGKVLTTIRGNRNITLMVLTDSVHINSPGIDQVFQSFRFIPQPSVWETRQSPDSAFTAWLPGPIMPKDEEFIDPYSIAYDTVTATTLFIYTDTLNKYKWTTDENSFWKDYVAEENRISEKQVRNGAISGKEFLVKTNKGDERYQRVRVLVNGNVVYKLFAPGDKELLEGENINRFFSSFVIHASPVAPDYTRSKAKLLLRDLSSSDSVIAAAAISALYEAQFAKEELPLLHEALFKIYPDDEHFNVNRQLGYKIEEINDPATIAYIKKQYPSLINEKAPLKATALTVLARTLNAASYTTLVALLLQSPPATEPGYMFDYALEDSLALTAGIFPELQQMARDSNLAPMVANVALLLRDSGYIKQEDIARSETDFLYAAAGLAPGLKLKEEYNQNISRLAELIIDFRAPASDRLLLQFLEVKNKYVRREIVVEMLRRKHKVPAKVISALAADAEMRANLYYELKELNRAQLFPKKYLSRQHFAESYIYSIAADEYDPQCIEWLSEKKGTVNGKTYLFHLFKVTFDEGEAYLGISGGFDPDGKEFEPVKHMSDLYWESQFDSGLIDQFFESHLEAYNTEEAEPVIEEEP